MTLSVESLKGKLKSTLLRDRDFIKSIQIVSISCTKHNKTHKNIKLSFLIFFMSLSSLWIEICQITKKSLFSKFRSRKSLEIYFLISQIIKNNCTQCQESFLIVQHLISSLNRGSKFFDPQNRSKNDCFFNLASPIQSMEA